MMEGSLLYKVRSKDSFPNRAEKILHKEFLSGKKCFLIGGGESLIGFDFNKLTGEMTIGVNKLIESYDPTILFTMDRPFIKMVENGDIDNDKWNNSKAIKVFIEPEFDDILPPNLYLAKRSKGLSTDIAEGIDPGTNSGYGALMLAISLGCKNIFLLGYDLIVKNQTHFHEGYAQQDIETQQRRMYNYAKGFYEVYSKLNEVGVRVFNLSMMSSLKCFPQIPFQAVNKVCQL